MCSIANDLQTFSENISFEPIVLNADLSMCIHTHYDKYNLSNYEGCYMGNNNGNETELSILLAFDMMTLGKDDGYKKSLAISLGVDYEEYTRRIVGKEKEAEFIIILKSLGCLKHFEAYDEGLSHVTNEFTPDFYVEFVDGYKTYIEVKSTEKDVFKISSGNLQKKKEYADRDKIPIRFAVSLKNRWGLFTIEDLIQKNGRLTNEDFWGEESISWFDVELATCSYIIPHGVKIRSVYMKNHRKGIGIYHDKYGELVSYELYYNGRKIFRLKGKNSPYITLSVYLEAIQDYLSSCSQNIRVSGDTTIVTESIERENDLCIIPEYSFLLAPIKHAIYDSKLKVPLDFRTFVSCKEYQYPDVQILRASLSYLVDNGLNLLVIRQNYGYRFNDYKERFWTKNNKKN